MSGKAGRPDGWNGDGRLTGGIGRGDLLKVYLRPDLGLVRDVEHREDIDPLVRAETSAWVSDAHASIGARRDGIPPVAFGPRSSAGPSPVRDFGRDRPAADRGWAVFEKRPQLALLGSSTDTRVDWLRAGQALERVLLQVQATSGGLATSMASQPLEWPELRWTVRDRSR
ncbi:hypothetical protein [Streptomyces sp. NBC_01233]|uniref:hypothetical protein n=1 Tax=Streptomyces sp. NBC_01233 TaxID=2903787 RepID=UPI002E162F68